MKKTTLFIILILTVLFISIIYYQNSLTKTKITSSTVKTPTGMVVEEQIKEENKEEITPIEEITPVEVIKEEEKPFPETFLTNTECVNGREITFTLNNILKKKIMPGKMTFYAAGYTLRNAVCDKEELNPEESTNCKLDFNIKLNKIIKFTIAYPGKSESVNIDCGK